jgi:hypothetical protein
VWTPDELCGVDPEDVQDRSIEHGHMVIDSLKVQSDNEPGALEPQRG